MGRKRRLQQSRGSNIPAATSIHSSMLTGHPDPHSYRRNSEPSPSIPPPHALSMMDSSVAPISMHHHQLQPNPDHIRTLRSETVSSSSSSYSTEGSVTDHRCQVNHRMTDPITEQEIKFTKTPGCTPSTCLCLLFAILLITLGASSGIYFGLKSYNGKSLRERVFKGHFVVTRGESYDPRYEEAASEKFQETSYKYRNLLNKLFNSSKLQQSFRRSEVIALEKSKEGSDDVVIHFNLHFKPFSVPKLNSADVYIILASEILRSRQGLFAAISVDPSSLDVTERRESGSSAPLLFYPFYPKSEQRPVSSRDPSYNYYRNPWEAKARFPGVLEGLATEPSPPVRRCQKIDVPFCASVLPYKETSYPNIMGHWNVSSVEGSFVDFRQLMDAECYPLSREYICRILQPECVNDELVFPCRDFCKDFREACAKWIERDDNKKGLFDQMTKCHEFPRFDGDDGEGDKTQIPTVRPFRATSRVVYFDEESDSSSSRANSNNRREKRHCRSKSGCENELKIRGRSHHVCDGIIDCSDASDEITTCDYCSSGVTVPKGDMRKSGAAFYCGNRQCVDQRRVCDGMTDCTNGADEHNCLLLKNTSPSHSLSSSKNNNHSNNNLYETSGILGTKIRGKNSLACVEKFENISIPLHRKSYLLDRIGSSVCSALGFRAMLSTEPAVNTDRTSLFSTIEEMNVDGIRLRQSETTCNSRQVIRITCDRTTLECGRNPLFTPVEQRSRTILTSSVQRIYEQFDRSIDLLPGSFFPANDGDWPWLVSLFRDGQFLCEGTLIEDQWILTSGSCFDDTTSFHSSSQWRAVMGTVRLSSKSQLFSQERDILSLVHSRSEQNQKKNSFNLSLLKMEHAFNASDYVRQACVHQATLSSTELRKLSNVDCYSTAWDVNSDRLQFVKANIIERDECEVLGEEDARQTREMSFCVRLAHLRDGLMTVSGRALYCATSSSVFSVVGVEAAFDVARRKKGTDQSTSLHLFIRTTHHSEWIRQIVDSFKRNAAAASVIHEVRVSPPDVQTNQKELSTARQPVYLHEGTAVPGSPRSPDLNWSPDKSL